MDVITTKMQINQKELKDDMNGLRNHLVSGDQELAAKFDQVDMGIKQISDEAKARYISLETHVANLEENGSHTPTTTTEDVPPQSLSVVVFGSYRIIDNIKRMDLHGYAYKDIYMPSPRDTKVRFRIPAEVRRLLDDKFSWFDRWMNIERARSENGKRPIFMVSGCWRKYMAEGRGPEQVAA